MQLLPQDEQLAQRGDRLKPGPVSRDLLGGRFPAGGIDQLTNRSEVREDQSLVNPSRSGDHPRRSLGDPVLPQARNRPAQQPPAGVTTRPHHRPHPPYAQPHAAAASAPPRSQPPP